VIIIIDYGNRSRLFCIAPKVQHIIAQGNALGLEIATSIFALKGQHNRPLFTLPFQGVYYAGYPYSQGVALGYSTSAFQAVHSHFPYHSLPTAC
jgi:hypothetical protein